MKCRVHVYLLNEHFSQEYADLHNSGQESEMNLRYEWEDELEITSDIVDVVEHEAAIYPLQGTMGDGSAFSYEVPAMRLFELKSEGGSTVLGCSESILDSSELESGKEFWVLRIFLKDYEPMANPIPGIYIAAQEFPKELID